MKYSLRQLEVFVAVGQLESTSRAAEQLAMSQSATSMALSELERLFNTQLFDRHGKRLQLNELGRHVLPRAMELLDRGREIEALLQGEAGVGPLRMGATLTIGNYLVPQLIGEYLRQHPGAQVALEVHNTRTIVNQVAHFELDFGLIEGSAQHPDLLIQPWVADELVVFAGPQHRLAGRTDLTMADVLAEAWIMREPGSGTRQTFDAAMRDHLPQINIRLALEHTEAIKRAVEAGLGIGCISRVALKDAFRRGSLVPLPIAGLDLRRMFFFVQHRDKFPTSGLRAMMALCRDMAQGVAQSDQMVLPHF